jgi:hypothetical protein
MTVCAGRCHSVSSGEAAGIAAARIDAGPADQVYFLRCIAR